LVTVVDKSAEVILLQPREAPAERLALSLLELRESHDVRRGVRFPSQAAWADVPDMPQALKEAHGDELLLVGISADHAGNLLTTGMRPNLHPQGSRRELGHAFLCGTGGWVMSAFR
jgi:hypothetical protein